MGQEWSLFLDLLYYQCLMDFRQRGIERTKRKICNKEYAYDSSSLMISQYLAQIVSRGSVQLQLRRFFRQGGAASGQQLLAIFRRRGCVFGDGYSSRFGDGSRCRQGCVWSWGRQGEEAASLLQVVGRGR